MKFLVTVEIPFEAKDGPQAQRLAEMALKRAGLSDFKVTHTESEESREARPLIEDEEEDDFSDLD